jgi:hypothetical protein
MTPTALGESPILDVFLSARLRDELAQVFQNQTTAAALLDKILFPIPFRPGSFDTSHAYWTQICQAVTNGITPRGMRTLLDAAISFYPGNRNFQRLSLEYSLLANLAGRLKGRGSCQSPEADECYRSICLEGWTGPSRTAAPRSPLEYACELIEHTVSPANPRSLLLMFVRRLRQLVDFEDCEADLTAWEEDALTEFAGRDALAREVLCAALPSPACGDEACPAEPFWLSIVVQPGKSGEDRFTVKGWLFDPSPSTRMVALLDGETLEATEVDLAGCLATLRNAAFDLLWIREQYLAVEQVHIEVFLPMALLCLEADQWLLPEALAGDAYPVGFHHPFVVRCLERWGDPGARLAIQARWNHITQAAGPPVVVASLPVPGYAAFLLDCPALSESASLELRRSGRVVCVLFGCPMHPHDEAATRSFGRILQAGVPAAVWLRRPQETAPNNNPLGALTDLVKDTPMQTLHCTVWQERQKFDSTPPNHISRNIGVMYEDPRRLPPDVGGGRRLSGPKGRRTP